MKPWLILDAYLDNDGSENFLPHFAGRPVRTLRPTSALPPLDPTAFRGVVITGSAAGVNDRRPWVQRTVAFTRRALQRQVPVLGVCFGHQVLAEAVAGPGAIRRAPLPEVGWFRIHRRPTPILDGFPSHFRTFLSHFDEVRPEVRPHLDVLASSERCPIQAFSVPGRPAWGVQFHAEMGSVETREIVRRHVGSKVPGDPERVLVGAVDSAPLIAKLIANFIRLAR
ncbi:MAG: GMP synthase (glutamine-hydrolyzing) [Myxococcota bacterium]|jgi:GMP synthase (glutamine-hydrolysing)